MIKTAFITGAGSGIGRGMAEAFADAGIAVALADIDGAAVVLTAQALIKRGKSALALTLDVAGRAAWDAAIDASERALGPLDLLCNNAGVAGLTRAIEDIPIEEWRWLTDINLYGVVHGMQCMVPRMKARGRGHIVNTSSIGGLVPLARFAEYMAAKHAVVGMSGVARQELAPFGIGVSVLCPGAVRTSLGETTLRHRPSRKNLAAARGETVKAQAWRYIDPVVVGRLVLKAVGRNQHFIFTHPENEAEVNQQFVAMREAFAALNGDLTGLGDEKR